MARRTLFEMLRGSRGVPIQGAVPIKSVQSITISGTSAVNSADFTALLVRVHTTVKCYIRFGISSATAVTTDTPMEGGTVEYFSVGLQPDGTPNTRLAAITDGGAGTVRVTECGD